MKFSLFILFFIFANNCFSKGIIIADEHIQTELFGSNDSTVIINFAETVALKYDKVILHLGKDFVFRKGNIFSAKTNKKNLSIFCKNLKEKKVTVLLWFFDSYGAENFIEIYKNHKEIINENINELKKNNTYYDGIAVDIEWINLYNYNNNEQFIELLQYLKNKVSDKKIFFFTSLINSSDENINRGYDINKIKSIPAFPVTMLYIKDGGFIEHKNSIVPNLDAGRIKELMKYYKKNKWNIAYSLESGYVSKVSNKVKFIGILNTDTMKQKMKIKKIHKKKYYTISDFIITEPLSIISEKGEKITFSKNEMIYFFQHRMKLPDNNCFLWEYFSIQNWFPEKSK